MTVLVALAAFFSVTGITSAFAARDQFESLQEELSGLGFSDLREADNYASLADQFGEAERSAGRARSRLRIAGLLTWLPVLGERIGEGRTQLEMAYFLARAGHGLTTTYREALASLDDPLADMEPGQQLALSLGNAAGVLAGVERDLQEARSLRGQLGSRSLNNRYAALLDSYLPEIQALTYISSDSPTVIGLGYELNLELAAVQELVTDPLAVLTSSEGASESFDRIIERSRKLSEELAPLRLALRDARNENPEGRSEIAVTIEVMERGARLLEQSTAGAKGLLLFATAAESDGVLTEGFAASGWAALNEAEVGLLLAQTEWEALEDLLAETGAPAESQPEGIILNVTVQDLHQVGRVLDRALQSTRFLGSFLGFQGPRNYLLLAQNQQEIRATGGFIGAAIRVTVDQGELVDVDFKDSTTVDFLPPEFPNNPQPPDPLYWYLWMGRLLFRDANWSPDFPTAAALVSDVYRLGQGVQLDGVVTGSKALLVDLIGVLGDIQVPGVAGALSRQQAQAYTDGNLPYMCTERHISTRGKRCFDEDAFFTIQERLTSPMTGEERAAVIELLRLSLKQNNVMIHIFDAAEAGLLWELGWNGAIPPVDHDYLFVVDSSLPGHTAKEVQRRIEYQTSLRIRQPAQSRLRVRYAHNGEVKEDTVCRQSEPVASNCYWNYFRVYVPGVAIDLTVPPVPLDAGAEKLIWGYPDPDSRAVGLSAGVGPAPLTEIGGFVAVPPDSVTTVPIEYQIPWTILRDIGKDTFEYRLLVQKQPGIDRDIVYIAVQVPAGAEVIDTSPRPRARNGRWLGFEFALDTDKQVVVSFRSPGTAAGGG